MNGKIKTNKST